MATKLAKLIFPAIIVAERRFDRAMKGLDDVYFDARPLWRRRRDDEEGPSDRDAA